MRRPSVLTLTAFALCIGWTVYGCALQSSKIDQKDEPPKRTPTSGPAGVVDAPSNDTGPQAASGQLLALNNATSIQTYMPWTLLLLIIAKDVIHKRKQDATERVWAERVDRLAELLASSMPARGVP